MINILNIETTTTNCSVSLSQNGETLVLKEDTTPGYSHAETLHLYIDEVVKMAGLDFKNLHAIAVSKGPGSYTGLRIGVSAAKGLSFALGIPLISVGTLKSLALKIREKNGYVIPLLDARRMEVYSAIFDSEHNEVRNTQAEIITETSFEQYLSEKTTYFVGNGVEKTKAAIKHSNAVFIENQLPSANEMSSLAYAKYKISDLEDVAYFEPYYLKDFIALKPKS